MAPTNFRTLAETTLISRALVAGALAVALLLPAGQAAARASLSDKICAAARKQLQTMPGYPTFYVTTDYWRGRWSAADSRRLLARTVAHGDRASWLYVAYIRPTKFIDAGALSVRIATPLQDGSAPTNEVELYRPAIPRGMNRCEPRGRHAIDRTVRVNQYIDYHARGAANSSLEDFHFAYPAQTRLCIRTDGTQTARRSHIFEDVRPTQGDNFFGRYFPFITPAYAVNNEYASLRSELHYRPSAQLGVSCVGFRVALTDMPAKVRVHEHGFYPFWALGMSAMDVSR